MTAFSSSSIVLVHPPAPAVFPHPPGRLSEMKAFISALGSSVYGGSAIFAEETWKGGTLLKLMEQVAADHHTVHWFWRREFPPTAFQRLIDALHTRTTPLKLSLACGIGNAPDTALPIPADTKAIVQLLWHATNRLPDLGFFKRVSRAGIWNHLILDGPAATAANRDAVARPPNIIHSW